MNIAKKTIFGMALAGMLITGNPFGNESAAQESRGRRHGPPPEAYTACEGKSAGDTAEFVSPRGGTVTGTCEQRGDRLVLFPDHIREHSGGKNRSSESTGRQNQGPPPEAYTACEGKSAGDTAELVSPRGDTVTGICVQEGDRLILHPDNPPDRRGMNSDYDAISYAIVNKHQIALYDSKDELVISLKEREPHSQDSQLDGFQAARTDTGNGPVPIGMAGLIWQQEHSDSKYRLGDAAAYPELLSSSGYDGLRLYSLTGPSSVSGLETERPHLDSTGYTLVPSEETNPQYWYSNFDGVGTDHDGIDAEYSVNLFTIDAQGTITGITRIIPDMIH